MYKEHKKRMILAIILSLFYALTISCSESDNGSGSNTPGIPEGVQATAGNECSFINWIPSENATSYNIYWNTSPGITASDNEIVNTTSPYCHIDLSNCTTYYYAVTAVNIDGNSGLSEEVSATPDAAYADVPSAPENLQAEKGDQCATLTWDPAELAVSYNIYWSNTPGVTKTDNAVLSVSSPFVHEGLTNYTEYYYAVTAVGFEGESGLSEEVSVTPSLLFTDFIQKIQATDPGDNHNFGHSVAINGDYAIVGSPNEDEGGAGAGAAYIFHRTGEDTWDTGIKIVANDAQSNDGFGIAVAIDGDYAIVGADGEDGGMGDPMSNAGAAYIFRRTGENTWDTGVKITAIDAQSGDLFGQSAAISGDYAIVGAYGEDGGSGNPMSHAGAAYIFHRTGEDTWDTGIKIVANDAQMGDYFGISIAICGDYAIVGAYNEDAGGGSAGAAYIYRRLDVNIWDSGVKIMAPDPQDVDLFGNSVAISGDYAIVGAYDEDGGSGDPYPSAGAAYIYRRIGPNTWDAGIKIMAPDAQVGDYFGHSVSISEDHAIVSSYNEDSGGDAAGAAYIFRRTDLNSWSNGIKIMAIDAQASDWFGISASISGDYAIVGASYEDAAGTNAGAAYFFKK